MLAVSTFDREEEKKASSRKHVTFLYILYIYIHPAKNDDNELMMIDDDPGRVRYRNGGMQLREE